MTSQRNIIKTLLTVVMGFSVNLSSAGGGGIQAEASLIDSPLELREACSFRDVMLRTDDYVTGHVTLVDGVGRSLILHKRGPILFYIQRNGKEVKSTLGSPEEQHLLTIMKASFAKQFNPPLKGTFEEQEHKKYYDQLTLEEFINKLQDRCATNKKARSQGH